MTDESKEPPPTGSRWRNESDREVTVTGMLVKHRTGELVVTYLYPPGPKGQPEQQMNLEAFRRVFSTRVA